MLILLVFACVHAAGHKSTQEMIEELLDSKLGPCIKKGLEKFEKKADKIMRQMARKIRDMRKRCHARGHATKHNATHDQHPHRLTHVHGTAEDTAYGSESQQSRRTSSNTDQPSEKSTDDSESILCQSPVMATADEIDEIDENFKSSRNVQLPQPCTSPPTSQPSSGKKSSDTSERIACESPLEATTGTDNESQLGKDSYVLGCAPMHEEPVSHGLSLQDTAFKQDALQTGALPQPSAPTQKLPLQLPTLQSPCQSPTPQSPCQSPGEKSLNEATTGIDNESFYNGIRSPSQHTTLTCPSTVLAREPEV